MSSRARQISRPAADWRLLAQAARAVKAFDRAEGGIVPAPVADELRVLKAGLEDAPICDRARRAERRAS